MIQATGIEIEIGKPDSRGRALVVAKFAGKLQHSDTFEIGSNFHRMEFGRRVAAKLPNGALPNTYSGENNHHVLIADEIMKAAHGAAADPDRMKVVLNRITAKDLAEATYKVEFHIPGILVAGQPQGIFGAKKSLKTSLALSQGIAIASGQRWLDHFDTVQTRVAVFSGESGMPTIQETCLRQCAAMGLTLADLPIVFSDTLPTFGSLPHMDAFERFLVDDEIGLVYVDPVYLCMLTGGNEGSLFAMGAMLRSVSDLCQRIGVTLVLLHHMKKGIADPYSPGDLDDASWAGFAEFCRGWMLINRREKYVPGSGMHKLWLSVGGSVGHGGLWGLDINEGAYGQPGGRVWQVEVLKPDDVRQDAEDGKDAAKQAERQARIERDAKAIVEKLVKYPAGDTKSAIRGRVGISAERMDVALAWALDRGHVLECGVVKGNQKTPREGYRNAS